MINKLRNIANNRNLIIGLYILGILTLLLFWSANQPFNSCPDESMRYVIPKFIFTHWQLPNANDKSIIDIRYGFSYASQPQLPYIISAIFMKTFSLFSSSDFGIVMAARMTSIFSGVIYTYFVIKIGELLFKRKLIRYIFIALCTLWPEAMFIFTYVNCDGLALMSISIMIYSWFSAYSNGWNLKTSILLSIGMSIALLSYMNAYVFVLLSLLVYVSYYIFVDKSEERLKKFFKFGFLIFGIVFLLTGWHFIRNIVLYNSILATKTNNYAEIYAIKGFSTSDRAAKAMATMSTLYGNMKWIYLSITSFIGTFGWMNLYSYIIYAVYFVIFIISIVGFVYVIKNTNKSKITKVSVLKIIIVILSIILPFIISYIFSFDDYQPQGRYAIGSLIPLCLVLTYCINELIEKFSNKRALYFGLAILCLIVFAAFYSEIIIYRAY